MNYKGTTIYTLFIFLFIALFGFLLMGTMNHNIHGSCPFSVGGSLPCPEEGVIVTTLHHVNMLDSFSAVMLGGSILNVVAFLFSAFIFAVFLSPPSVSEKSSWHDNFVFKNYKKFHEEVFLPILMFLSWILHTKDLSSGTYNNKAHVFMPA